MSTKYFSLLTDSGANKLEDAATSGNKFEITHMAVGDGNLPTPNANQTQLINERHRAEIDRLFIDPKNPNQIVIEQILPEDEGSWWIREIGLFDKSGTLVAIGNCAELYKSQMHEQTIRMLLPIDNINLIGSFEELFSGLATRRYVRDKIRDHAESRNHPDATLKNKGFVILSNAVDSNSEAHAATSKAVKSANELALKAADSKVPLTRRVNDKELVNDITLTAADVGAYTKDETDARIKEGDAQVMKVADSKVPLTRRVNDKELVNDITLTAADVGAYSKDETDARIKDGDAQVMKVADSKVPLTRRVNDKELVNDITLTAADVGAYSKDETDSRIKDGDAQVMQETQKAMHEAQQALKAADSKVPLTRRVNDKELVNDITLTAANVGAYSKDETDSRIKDGDAQVMQETQKAMHEAQQALKAADGKVPLIRRVNDKELVNDITLTAADVGAYSKDETDSRIKDGDAQVMQETQKAMHEAQRALNEAQQALKAADSKVPLTRRVNDKELVNDITLTAANVGAYSKDETDARIKDGDAQVMKVADSKVPLTRRVNDKELVNDITLTAADVGAYSKDETDSRIKDGDAQVMQETQKAMHEAQRALNEAQQALKAADSKVPLTRRVNDKELVNDITLTAADVGAYSKDETDSRIKDGDAQVMQETQKAMHEAQRALNEAQQALKAADSKVPLIRRVNDKELVNDITLTAADVGAYSKDETDSRIKDGDAPIMQAAQQALKAADSKVPLTRRVNDKELVNDITLTAADVGAYSKDETDSRIKDGDAPIMQAAQQALKAADSKVPLTRRVNDKELVNDITLTAADVGAYSKEETDTQVMKVADTKVPLTRRINDKELVNDITLTAADVGAYNKDETDSRIKDGDAQVMQETQKAMHEAQRALNEAQQALKAADSKVPLTRRVNDKELVNDITLTAADVGAYSKDETDSRIKDGDAPIMQAAQQALKAADSKVPLTRRVNDKELVNDITLTAADVGAYSKEETDTQVMKVADTKVPLTRRINDKELVNDIALTAADVGAYSKDETDSRIKDGDAPIMQAAQQALKAADSKVPLTRRVNDKELVNDITLTAADVGAYSKDETDSRIKDGDAPIMQAAQQALKAADSKVPLTRRVNDKELVNDITLTAADVGAYSKDETDSRIKDGDTPIMQEAQKAMQEAQQALKAADSKVPLTRRVNDKELVNDIALTAADVGAYSKEETDTQVMKVADTKVPLTRRVNDKELVNDITLTAADVGAYSKNETDSRIKDGDAPIMQAAQQALKAADSKVPLTRRVNDKELVNDITLTAADVGAYSKEETNTQVMKVADTKVPLTRRVNDKELVNDITLTAADVGAYSKDETDSRIKDGDAPIMQAAQQALKAADSKVPLTRRVNDKELVNDITLTAADVGAYSKDETDSRIKDGDTPIMQEAQKAMQEAQQALKAADSKVPLTRRVNDKELVNDITLTAADVGAYSKEETNTQVMKVADTKVPLTRRVNDKELVNDIALTAADVGAYSKDETDSRIKDGDAQVMQETQKAIHEAQRALNEAQQALKAADSKVPLTRRVNDKELVNDITLTAADVGAYSKEETNTQVMKVADTKVPLTRRVNDKELVNDITLTAADVGAYSKDETDSRIKDGDAQVMQETQKAMQEAQRALKAADSKVPLTRRVNDKELVNDIALTAADVGAYSKDETDSRIKDGDTPIMQEAQKAMQEAQQALKAADSKVPLTRRVNDKELVNDITLTAANVGAYSKDETDSRIKDGDAQVMQETQKAIHEAQRALNEAQQALKAADSKVPLTRRVNDKELVNDIKLVAADVGAYSKSETDARIKDGDAPIMKVAESKVPLTRRINNKELVNDIKLVAADVDAYNKEETSQLIDNIHELVNSANNNADSKVPMTRTVNHKALLTDITLTASDIDTYTRGEIDQQIHTVRKLANDANNNVNGKVPLTRTVNSKALLTDIVLTASDVGAYSKNEVDSRIAKVNTNANSRLAKNENGADIPDKNAFVRNLGLANLVGLNIESRLIGQEATVIRLGDIIQINGVAVASDPIQAVNMSVIGGITYYTNYYKVQLPISLSNGIISCHASIVGDNFDGQNPSYPADVKTQRNNPDGMGISKDTLTISVITPQLGWTPQFYYEVMGY
ncbi:phage tail protein [Xenorhabdus budapestensis]|uniref:Phage tail protein n=2 Tax=Xenorhabdus budapestensis TaxID=290110 RepID=A0ABX7VGZ4_XENBU|nr:phage tail protein [Xenorhabdus budapestensis]QTL38720.1 phage tail protein [Xenorhabdus budapestensis]